MNVHVAEGSSKIQSVASHPLDPLSTAEIQRAAAIIRDHYAWGDDLRVETIDVDEPAKDVVRAIVPGAPFQRIARFNAFRRGHVGVWQGRVDLETGKVVSERFDETARAMVAVEEVFDIERAVRADPRFQEALRRRGLIDELDYMCVDPWTVGDFGHEVERGRRVLNCFIWMRTFPLDNYYAHPVEGLHALIDLATLEILEVEDHFEKDGDYIPVPRTPLNYDAELLTTFRQPSARLDVVQPDGPGFQGRRSQGHLGELGLPGRVQRPRRARAASDRLYGRRHASPRRLSGLHRRDGRALRDAGAQPLSQERLRQR